MNEYQLEDFDAEKALPHPSRTASRGKLYAEATREVGSALQVPVADIWTAFMTAVGWKEGQPLPGSRDLPNNESLRRLSVDGLFSFLPPVRLRLLLQVVLCANGCI